MELMDIIWTTLRDISYSLTNYPLYSFIAGLIFLILMIRIYGRRGLGYHSKQDMKGKTVLITGATAGVGKATAMDMARRNARVIMACRNFAKAQIVADEIKMCTGNDNVVIKLLDLASFKSVLACAEDVNKTEDRLDVLINNAGIMVADKRYTEDGCEMFLQSNHFGHFLLTMKLLYLLRKSAPSRIINLSSRVYTSGKLNLNDLLGKNIKGGLKNLYPRSKLANILFTRELAKRLKDTGVTVNALHPGVVQTDLANNAGLVLEPFVKTIMYLFGKTAEEGAQTSIYLAIDPDVENVTGKYFSDCREEKLKSKAAVDDELAKKFFALSEKIVRAEFQ